MNQSGGWTRGGGPGEEQRSPPGRLRSVTATRVARRRQGPGHIFVELDYDVLKGEVAPELTLFDG